MPSALYLSDDEHVRLQYVQLTAAAEQHLVSLGTPCPDHDACRHLAFARFLFLTRRVGDDLEH
jgi:hypothetical protein